MSHQPLLHQMADARRQDMLAQAEQERAIAQTRFITRTDRRPAAIVAAAVRRRIGTVLVRTGERLQGAGATAELDAHPSVGVLRIAR